MNKRPSNYRRNETQMNHRHIQIIVLALAILGMSAAGVLLFGSQVSARSFNIDKSIPANRLQGATQLAALPAIGCANGDYSIVQTTGASIITGTTDIGNHTDDG